MVRVIHLFMLVFFFSQGSFAQSLRTSLDEPKETESTKTVVFGHNLSPTNHLLAKGQSTAGFYALGIGVSDKFTLATSPWIVLFYDMINIITRYRISESNRRYWSGQTAYFKTSNDLLGFTYTMEAISQNLIYSMLLQSGNHMHFNMNYMYFLDETKPFSLRREPLNNDPWQVTFTALFEGKFTDTVGLLGEAGVLGVNYHYPQLIMGASFFTRFNNWFLQFGYSITTRPLALFSTQKVDNNEVKYSNGVRYPSQERALVDMDFSVHPEIQIQYFF